MGIVRAKANFHGSETDFPWRKKKIVHGEEKSGVQKTTTGSSDFSSALNTRETKCIYTRLWLLPILVA